MDAIEVGKRLAAPFAPGEIQWRAIVVKGRSALAAPYVDVRAVQRRLEEVLGIDGWQDTYQAVAHGCIECTLRIRIGDQWTWRTDVGAPISRRRRSWWERLLAAVEPDDENAVKSAYSDALKRAAVKFGVGRDLDKMLKVWVAFDPSRGILLQVPVAAVAGGAHNGTSDLTDRPRFARAQAQETEAQVEAVTR